jgi:hypothetical protein
LAVSVVLPAWLVLSALSAPLGCTPEGTDDDESCNDCNAGEKNITCELDIRWQIVDTWVTTCVTSDASQQELTTACQNVCGAWNQNHSTDCIGFSVGDSMQCLDSLAGTGVDDAGGWDIGSLVDYNSSTQEYEIDDTLVDALKADASILANDKAHLSYISGGYWEFQDIEEGSLAYHLGFEDGDEIREINEYALKSMQDVLAARAALDSETELVVEFVRGSTTHTHTYVIE